VKIEDIDPTWMAAKLWELSSRTNFYDSKVQYNRVADMARFKKILADKLNEKKRKKK
jgi:hypothetical protein